MLIEKVTAANMPRNIRHERRLWHRPQNRQLPLGCQACKEFSLCGGLQIEDQFFDCDALCCGNPVGCSTVCRNNPAYARRVREVGTFALEGLPHYQQLPSSVMPPVVQIMYHGSGLRNALSPPAVCLPLFKMIDRSGRPRFHTGEALRRAYSLAAGTRILLTGTSTDQPLERWWGLGASDRLQVIRALHACDVELVTTPNFTLFANKPRWNDLHAIKRIAITHCEFLSEGVPAALHVNGRTDADYGAWATHIAARNEITHIAFEFTTLRRERREQHVAWLRELAGNVGRPLKLVVRGGSEVVPRLVDAFDELVFLDTDAFLKTQKRKRAVFDHSGQLKWIPAPTAVGEPLDDLLSTNFELRTRELIAQLAAVKPGNVS